MPGMSRLDPITLTSEGIVHVVKDRNEYMQAWANFRANIFTGLEVMTLCEQKKRIAGLVRNKRVTCLICIGALHSVPSTGSET